MNDLALVTGASGFVGGNLARRLLDSGRRVRALSRSPMPDLTELGAEIVRADIADASAVRAACEGASTVFHTAARVGIWGPRAEFERTNIRGAIAVVAGCRLGGVARLVFTSSPSVVFNRGNLAGADESQPLGTDFRGADYPRTKADAERHILAAHEPGRLATCALRPHLVWGVGDQNLIPRVVARARAGRLRMIGDGKNRVDLTHIENVVDAHLLAEAALARPNPIAGGRAYFITNGEPVALWPWINALLQRLALPRVEKHLSLRAAERLGAACEYAWRTLHLRGEPPLTRFLAAELAHDHWFDIRAAQRDLGYAPRISMEQGLAELLPVLRASR